MTGNTWLDLLMWLIGAVVMGNYLYWFLNHLGVFRKGRAKVKPQLWSFWWEVIAVLLGVLIAIGAVHQARHLTSPKADRPFPTESAH